jgi:hypothetical protein
MFTVVCTYTSITSYLLFSFLPGTQVLYLVDESEETGKQANSVISMLHHQVIWRDSSQVTYG